MSFALATASASTLNFRGRLLVMGLPRVMGILNLTPDSFSDGGQHATPAEALARAQQMLAEGAHILDLGAYSSRPGAPDVSAHEEWSRLAEPLRLVRAECPNALISVDTFRASVAERALEAGADAINDISAGRWDPQLLPVVARERVPYFAMHAQGTPQTMQLNPQYADVVQEVYGFFVERLNALAQAGIYDVVLDPGFGFGKSVEHNYALLRHLAQFRALGRPLLVGISRKSMLTRALGIGWRESLPAATALHLHALQQGASLLRVHDVAPACQAIQLFNLLNGA